MHAVDGREREREGERERERERQREREVQAGRQSQIFGMSERPDCTGQGCEIDLSLEKLCLAFRLSSNITYPLILLDTYGK
jgi:hypothetical protein